MKLKQHYETETFVSQAGYYVINQTGFHDQEYKVLLTRDQARRIRDDITAQLRQDWEEEE